jgi:hypothetical protein
MNLNSEKANDLRLSAGCLDIVGSSIRLVDEDILAIEEGLRELDPDPARFLALLQR